MLQHFAATEFTAEAEVLGSHPGRVGGEDGQDLLVRGAGDGRGVVGELVGGEVSQRGAGGCQFGEFAVGLASSAVSVVICSRSWSAA
ncbi:hypothetical protein ACSNOB_10825 [Micromonospora sp. URMC 106]|uniref:hypothetical protein n=1 Tax=Micromonospora sp. URMC 106 TaxID=3423408 RepID=UPI003F1B1523